MYKINYKKKTIFKEGYNKETYWSAGGCAVVFRAGCASACAGGCADRIDIPPTGCGGEGCGSGCANGGSKGCAAKADNLVGGTGCASYGGCGGGCGSGCGGGCGGGGCGS